MLTRGYHCVFVSRVRRWYQAERDWWRRWMGQQPTSLGDGEWDHPKDGGRGLVRPDQYRRPGIGTAMQQGGGDGADRQGSHDLHGVPGDRGVEPDLGLIQPEAALAEAMGELLTGLK